MSQGIDMEDSGVRREQHSEKGIDHLRLFGETWMDFVDLGWL